MFAQTQKPRPSGSVQFYKPTQVSRQPPPVASEIADPKEQRSAPAGGEYGHRGDNWPEIRHQGKNSRSELR